MMIQSLRILHLGGNNITAPGCLSLSKAILVNKSLVYLSLARNCIGAEGVVNICMLK
jgi:hypothetical protein